MVINKTTQKTLKLAIELLMSACEQGAQKKLGYTPRECAAAFVTAAFEILRYHLPPGEDSIENTAKIMHTQVDMTTELIKNMMIYARQTRKPTGLNLIFTSLPRD